MIIVIALRTREIRSRWIVVVVVSAAVSCCGYVKIDVSSPYSACSISTCTHSTLLYNLRATMTIVTINASLRRKGIVEVLPA